MHHRPVSHPHALPPVVAIHRVISPGHRRNLTHPVLPHFLLQGPQKIDPTFRRRVAPVHKAMHENAFHFVFARHPQQRVQMLDMRMHSAVAHQSQQMQLMRPRPLHRVQQQRLPREFAAGDQRLDPRRIHVHHAPRANIQMPHFAVAHLPRRQSHRRPRSLDQSVGKLAQQPVVIRLPRQRNRIPRRLRPVAPPVQHRQHNWFRSHECFDLRLFLKVGDRIHDLIFSCRSHEEAPVIMHGKGGAQIEGRAAMPVTSAAEVYIPPATRHNVANTGTPFTVVPGASTRRRTTVSAQPRIRPASLLS